MRQDGISKCGFSLHANTAINTHSRDRLGSLVEYLARGPLSNERLTIKPKGDVELTLKSRWRNDTTHLLFSTEEFLGNLIALIPPPRTHLVRGGESSPHTPHSDETLSLDLIKRKDFSLEARQSPRMRREPKCPIILGPRCWPKSSK